MRGFYPNIKPYKSHSLAVQSPHELYVEECGSPDGIPVLFVHGGPGGGCSKQDRSFFDPEKYRIILFDQRGCGRSAPHASLQDNSSQALVEDMEVIRHKLGVDKWLLFGGSWGSTLSLLYAQAHPKRVSGLILRGIFLCRQRDINWFYQAGADHVFPDYWRDYQAPIPEVERGDMVAAYYRRLTGDNELERMSAAKAWSIWEGRCATLHPNPKVVEHLGSPHVALAMARVECHYFYNKAFLEDNQLLDNANKLKGIPGIIVHGRYDMVCPVDQAFALHRAWPEARLEIIRDAGHAASEPGTLDALVKATDEMANKLGDLA
ncbi:MAG: prolyl aminopeptidase [Porticoccaceae bacterium]|nr:prolyl aminopeptidase [Porticoccaceae bacterium]